MQNKKTSQKQKNNITSFIKIIKFLSIITSIFFVIYTIFFVYIIFFHDNYTVVETIYELPMISDKGPFEEDEKKYNETNQHNIPTVYRYREGNNEALQNWLKTEESILSQEPYFSTIIDSAKKYDLNPCLLFAITGKEQSFVPSWHSRALEIVNNPFNVFGSWQIYNTSLSDSADIACETILKISKDRPINENFLKWLNTRDGTGGYAEDPLWHKGVDKFFKIMDRKVY